MPSPWVLSREIGFYSWNAGGLAEHEKDWRLWQVLMPGPPSLIPCWAPNMANGVFLKWKKISILKFFCHILIFKSTAVPFHPKILITLQRFWLIEANNCDVSISRSYFTKKMVSSCNSWVTQSLIAKCPLKITVSYVHNYTYQCSRHVGFLQQRDSSLWLATITYLCSTSVSCLQIFLHRLFHFILALRQ